MRTALIDRLLAVALVATLVGSIALWTWLLPSPGAWHWLLVLPTWVLTFWWPLVAYLRRYQRLVDLGRSVAP